MKTRISWFYLAAFLLVLANYHAPGADTLHVGAGQTYTTIQSAVDAAGTGDVVLVYEGTYAENIVISRPLTVISSDFLSHGRNDGAIVDAGVSLKGHGIHVLSDSVTITGLSVFGALGYTETWEYRRGIFLDTCSGCLISDNRVGWDEDHRSTIEIHVLGGSGNNIIHNTTYGAIQGIMVQDSRGNLISRNTAVAAASMTYSAGIYLAGGYNSTTYELTSTDNTITENVLRHDAIGLEIESMCLRTFVGSNHIDSCSTGLWVSGSCQQATISGNVIHHNGGGIHVVGSMEISIVNNVVDDDYTGIWLGYLAPGDYGASRCDVAGNVVTNCSDYGVLISPTSHYNSLSRNTFSGNGTNVHSEGTSWQTATMVSYFYGGNRRNHLGNYYDTFAGTDSDGDGVGDSDLPFRDGDTMHGPIEYYPLMVPPVSFDVQAWFLAADSARTMYRGNEGTPLKAIDINASSSIVWISDAPANSDVTFPNAPWSGKIRFAAAPPPISIEVAIGSSTGSGDFTPSGAMVNIGDSIDVSFETSAAAVSVNAGQYLALRLTNKKTYVNTIVAGGPFSFCSSTGMGDPVWPSSGTDVRERAGVQHEFQLLEAYPNPFNPVTNLRYQIAQSRMVTLTVYDVLGREIAVLVNEWKSPGSYELRFDGRGLASGVYYCRLKAGAFIQTKKMMLLR